jgi:hypothetical protein
LGPAIKPDNEAKKVIQFLEQKKGIKILSGAGAPTYRIGGLMKLFTGGQTIGRSIMVTSDTDSEDAVRNTWLHESWHFYQQTKAGVGGVGGQLIDGMYEQWITTAIHLDSKWPYYNPHYREFDARSNGNTFYEEYLKAP